MAQIKITAVSDLHGHTPKTDGGDILIVAGDLTASDKPVQYERFFQWLYHQEYDHKIVVAGNHDGWIEVRDIAIHTFPGCIYLENEGIEIDGINIWGSPHTKKFIGVNPLCAAFMCDTEEDLDEYWQMIPEDTDIVVTHGPPKGVLDLSYNRNRCGSETLLKRVMDISPQYHIFGHLHESYGTWESGNKYHPTKFINASHVNRMYDGVNDPVNFRI